MMISTKAFGNIDIDESKVITFENGLPGFPENKKFIILSDNEEDSFFYWLQSVENESTAFPMIDTFSVIKEYSPKIEKEELGTLENSNQDDLLVYNIVRIPDDPKETTINLKAPVIVDTSKMVGRQVIASNDEYSTRHYFVEQLKNK